MKYNELFWFNVLEFRARFKLENEFSSDMSYFWYSDAPRLYFKLTLKIDDSIKSHTALDPTSNICLPPICE